MSRHTILIVDDSPLQAIMLRRTLTQAGFQIVTAKHGLEGLEFLKKQPIDLIISDVNMPKLNGFELCRSVKSDPQFKHIPFILCTVLSSPADLIEGIQAGAENYITIPWHDQNLFAIIDELLKSPPPDASLITKEREAEDVFFEGKKYTLRTDYQHLLNFLLSTYQNVYAQNQELIQLREEVQKAYSQLEASQREQEKILLRIFPGPVAQELIAYGSVTSTRYEDATIMFIDMAGFTKSTLNTRAQDLVNILEFHFENFDAIIERHNLERIKTIGDGYMCVSGVPVPNENHAVNCVLAALDIVQFIAKSQPILKQRYNQYWPIRVGINTGPVVAGVIGKKKPAYDIWGAAVNLASRMESHSERGKINISASTYEKVKNFFIFTPRGRLPVESSGGIDVYVEMYFVEDIKQGIQLPS